MEHIAHVVVPVDGSAAANRGLDFAAEFARSEGATIEVCSAVDTASIILPIAEGALINPGPMIEELERATAKHVAEGLARLQTLGASARGTVVHGDPVSEIDALVRQQPRTAIVLGTNGRGSIERLFMGSVTSALLRLADGLVVTVHADDTLRPGPILVAIDASPASLVALDFAIERAHRTGVALQLLHVLDEHRIDRLSSALHLQSQGARRRALAQAEEALDDAADRVRAGDVAFSLQIERGTPIDAILTAAQRHGAGAIAIGTHGRGGLEQLVLGSVAVGVVCRAHIPVYVCHRARSPKPAAHRVGRALADAVAWQPG